MSEKKGGGLPDHKTFKIRDIRHPKCKKGKEKRPRGQKGLIRRKKGGGAPRNPPLYNKATPQGQSFEAKLVWFR